VALAAGRHEVAIKAFEEAQKLFPRDATSSDLLKEAHEARDKVKNDLARQAKEAEEARLRAAKVEKALERGKAALQSGDLKTAAQAVKEAADLAPKAGAVLQAQKDLAKAEAEQKQRQADFQTCLDRGRKALTDKRLDEAVKEFREARRLLPQDRTALDLLRQAETSLKTQQDATAAALRAQQLLAQGKAALKAKKWDDAVKAFEGAVKAMPTDKEAGLLLKSAQEEQKKQAEYTRQLALGKAALAAKKWDDALTAFTAALKMVPADPEATRGMQAANEGKKSTPDPKVEYTRLMTAAAAFEKQQKYFDALQAYKDALAKLPGDAKASAGVTKVTQYNQRLIDANKAAQAKRWADAVKECEEALKLYPDSTEAKKALQKAKDKKP
jgi:tetratricopeptide (TPR) repeat protein